MGRGMSHHSELCPKVNELVQQLDSLKEVQTDKSGGNTRTLDGIG